MDFDNTNKYLLICGTTKAATTSLFNYLKSHPEVCPSIYKETRFFIDEVYPITRHDLSNKLSDYCALFQGNGLRLEATPDYLHSVGTPQRLVEKLADFKIVLILRDPVDRFLSWYRFAQQNGKLGADTTLNDFFNMQCEDVSLATDQYQLALIQGRYIDYLKNYLAYIDRMNIFIGFYEDLSRDPLAFIRQLCTFAAIDSSFYDDYTFGAYNVTRKARSSFVSREYREIKRRIRQRVRSSQKTHDFLVKLNRFIEGFIYGENAVKHIEQEDMLRLKNYYKESVFVLKNELGLQCLPWANYREDGREGIPDET